MKSPALDQALLPLKRLAADAIRKAEEDRRLFEVEKIQKAARVQTIKESIKKLSRKGEDFSDLALELSSLETSSAPPTTKRYIVNDSTVEKLGELLSENPNGILIFRDELTGLLRSLDREGHESDRAFYLEGWNGTGSFTYDRIARGTVHIPAVCLSLFGGIQPGPLAEYVREAGKNGSGADGLLQRFQLLVWPDDPGAWRNVDRWPDTVAKNRAYEVFEKLDQLDPLTIGAKFDEGEDIPFLRFTDEAQEAFDAWREILEKEKLRSGEPEIIEAALSKYRSLIPSLALLFHLIDSGSGPVGLDSFLRAVEWGDYLESHLRRIYQIVGNPALAGAHALVKKILKGEVEDGMTLRDIYRKGWTGLDSETTNQAMEILGEYGIARIETSEGSDKGGRPALKIRINPKFGRGAK
jgi:putative DNA primase/helicase